MWKMRVGNFVFDCLRGQQSLQKYINSNTINNLYNSYVVLLHNNFPAPRVLQLVEPCGVKFTEDSYKTINALANKTGLNINIVTYFILALYTLSLRGSIPYSIYNPKLSKEEKSILDIYNKYSIPKDAKIILTQIIITLLIFGGIVYYIKR